MNPKLGTSSKVMKGVEWALLFFFGFLVIRRMNPMWLSNTEIFMPVILPISTALYIIYTVLITGFAVVITILLLTFGLGGNSEKLLSFMLKDMTIDKVEKLRIKQTGWIWVRSVIEDILMVYFSWVLDKHYLAILAVIVAVESIWFIGVWNQIADKLKIRFYDALQKEAEKKEKAESEKNKNSLS